MEPKKIALAAVAALTFIMLAASCGGNAWQSISSTTSYGSYSASSGLWKVCGNDICQSYSGYTLLLFFIPSSRSLIHFLNRLFQKV